MADDFSFDIVSEVDWMEVQNAVQQAIKEIGSRFDFKGTAAEIRHENKETIVLVGNDEHGLKSVRDVLDSKLVRRGVSLKSLEEGPIEPAAKATVRQTLTLKVQPTIQGDKVRVAGKKKDDLQAVMTAVKAKDWPRALQFQNYR
jgi:uncharacterized protein YajQ (UPF0234 family)